MKNTNFLHLFEILSPHGACAFFFYTLFFAHKGLSMLKLPPPLWTIIMPLMVWNRMPRKFFAAFCFIFLFFAADAFDFDIRVWANCRRKSKAHPVDKIKTPQPLRQWGLRIWSGWWESNPRIQLGRLVFYHWTTPASLDILSPRFLLVNRFDTSVQFFVILLYFMSRASCFIVLQDEFLNNV